MAGAKVDLSRLIDGQKFNGFHVWIIFWCFLVQLADGFDINAAAYVAPALVKEWHLNRADLGPLFSAGLSAGFFGPLFFGFIADRYGRRLSIIAGTFVFGIFTVASVLATSLGQLIVLRFLAGLGMSGALPMTVALVNEFAPRRIRATLVIVMFSGSTFGGGVPGPFASWLVPTHGWQILFWIGGILPLVLTALLVFALPESVKFLALRPARRGELLKTLDRMGLSRSVPNDSDFVIGGEANRGRFSLRPLFEGRLALLTPFLWLCFAITTMSFYFINSWMPTILTGNGVPLERAVYATTLFSFGGTLGAWVIMRPFDRYGFIPVTILYLCAIPIVASIGLPGLSETGIMAMVAAAGFCLLGLNFGNIAAAGNIYPTEIRGFGVGSAFFIGRIGSVIGPLVGGLLIARQVTTQHIFFLFAVPIVVAALASMVVVRLYWRQYQSTSREEVPLTVLANAK